MIIEDDDDYDGDDGIERICPVDGSELELDMQVDGSCAVLCNECGYTRALSKDEIKKLDK